jgi:signal transduction histidine kinase
MRRISPGARPSASLPWIIVTLIAISCCVLAVLQYRWITEFSAAERDRMRADLQSRLGLLSRDFDREVSDAVRELIPETAQIEKLGREKAYAARFHNQPILKRIALAIPRDNFEKSDLILEILDSAKQQFVRGAWPEEWTSMRSRLMSRMDPSRSGPPRDLPVDARASTLMEIPRFAESGDRPGFRERVFREEEWLIVELNENYLRETTLPALLKKYLEEPNGLNYDTELTLGSAEPAASSDASVPLLSVQFRITPTQRGPGREMAPQRFGRRGSPPDGFGPLPGRGRGEFRPPANRPFPLPGPPPEFARAGFEAPRWRLYVRHRAGSLEALTARARNRNIMISGGLLLLILSIVGLLLRLSRQSQKLAESHMNFVTGVSHELRTPLTVIRTAAYNLRGKLSNRPDQVEKYGKLIQDESERLGALVEQVLQFASGEAGHQIRERAPVAIESLIDDSLSGSVESLQSHGIEVDKRIDAGLPPALVDRLAMSHALRNLIDNAVKYGTEKNHWIGVTAAGVTTSGGATGKNSAIEIRIADRGPGIPADEQAHIFDPFFRGSRALSDQVHGTGLGLNLTRRIIEAHGGTIEVKSSGSGTEFVVRIPAAYREVRAEVIA